MVNILPKPLKGLYNRIILISDGKIDSSNLEFDSHLHNKNLIRYVRANKNENEEISNFSKHLITIVQDAKVRVFNRMIESSQTETIDTSSILTNIDYASLENELNNYEEQLNFLIEEITNNNLPSIVDDRSRQISKNKGGRKTVVKSFNSNLNNHEIESLFCLEIKGLANSEFIIQNDKTSATDLKIFKNVLTAKDFSLIKEPNNKIIFGVQLNYIAFIFRWFERKGKMISPFTAISNSRVFYSSDEEIITAKQLNQAAKYFDEGHFIKEVIGHPQNLEAGSKKDDVFYYLHSTLTELTSKKR